MNTNTASFRDDAGYIFERDGRLFRAITTHGLADYERLMQSGLYEKLIQKKWIVPHHEVSDGLDDGNLIAKTIEPERIPFISYPYEWCFSGLKEAALLTLRIQKLSLQNGLSLKDASAFNIQFIGARPVFIDTLSFEPKQDRPWVAYKQFCQHFLAPLVLMSRLSPKMNQLFLSNIDGVPLDVASALLPFWSRFKPAFYMHLVLHGKEQKKHQADTQKVTLSFGINRQLAVLDHLESTLAELKLPNQKTTWRDYVAEATHYSIDARDEKLHIIQKTIDALNPSTVWDFGGNVGVFSRLSSSKKINTVCFDVDPLCVEINYREAKEKNDEHLLPLVMDFANPTPAIGWHHQERRSLVERGPCDLGLALALIHHLRITENIPFKQIAAFFAATTKNLMIEFVPKDDVMTQRLLANREDVFHDYSVGEFERLFSEHFVIEHKEPLPNSSRVLYLMKQKG